MDLRPGTANGGGLALDAAALAGLKAQAKNTPERALRSAATQFEALFLQQLMKSMRAAMPGDGPFDSDTTRTYTEMLDAQLAQTLAKKGTGIADMLVQQLSRVVGGAKPGATGPAGEVNRAAPSSLRPSPLPLPLPAQAPARISAAPAPAAAPGTVSRLAGAASAAVTAAGDFIATMRPYAEKAAQALGVPANFLVAQAGLETGWGKHQPRTTSGAPSHNLFGIKAGASWKGAVVEAETTEFVAGKAVRTVQRFRAYASPQEAFTDFAAVLAGNGRYAAALGSGNAESYAAHMQRAGYATDPAYGDKLARTIRSVARHPGAHPQILTAQVVPAAADNNTKAA